MFIALSFFCESGIDMSQKLPSHRSVALTQIGNLVSNSTDAIHVTCKVTSHAMYGGMNYSFHYLYATLYFV